MGPRSRLHIDEDHPGYAGAMGATRKDGEGPRGFRQPARGRARHGGPRPARMAAHRTRCPGREGRVVRLPGPPARPHRGRTQGRSRENLAVRLDIGARVGGQLVADAKFTAVWVRSETRFRAATATIHIASATRLGALVRERDLTAVGREDVSVSWVIRRGIETLPAQDRKTTSGLTVGASRPRVEPGATRETAPR